MPDTVFDVFEATARAHAARPAMQRKRAGSWEPISWAEYRDAVRRAARGLVALGVGPGTGVTIMSFSRPEWYVANIATMAAGGLPAGVYTTNTPAQCHYIADHAEAVVAIVENRQYLERFLAVRERLPRLKTIVMMEGEPSGEGVISWAELLERGSSVEAEEIERRIAAARPEDVCTLIYTSGTTGAPKAVMLTHRNISWIAEKAVELLDIRAEDRLVAYLPLSHVAEQIASLYTSMSTGACVYFAESFEKLAENLREVRPSLFLGVPRVWEKIQAGIQVAGAQNSPLKKKIAAWARRVGLAAGYADQKGRPRPWTYPIAHRLVFSKVRASLGMDETRFAIASAAPMAVETHEFFLSLGIPIMDIWGMSELTGPATISLPSSYRTGYSGRVIPGSEMKLADDGELLVRGPHVFKGYYKNEETTRETLDADGWLHSGDVAEFDDEGFLRITDRKKELIITAGGKNIAPQFLEGKLKQIPAVSQAVAIGDRRPYVAALLTVDPSRVAAEAEKAGSPAGTAEEAASCPVFKAYVEKQVEEINHGLARYEQIKRVALLPSELTTDGGELTPTMKLKRRVIHEKHHDVIEALYA
ncbi:MAG: AMP-binding protein [Acidobacteria bacterium]|nr:AMP-binding protein [Acidobacteriota bacterium]